MAENIRERGRRRSSPEQSFVAALGRSTPFPAFPGSKQRGIESGRTYASCVIHPWHFLASGRLWSGDAMEAEALRGGPRRRAAYRRPGQVLAYGH